MPKSLFVCRSKDCRKHRRDIVRIVEATASVCDPVDVKCQGICKGPVVGFKINKRFEWFKKLRGAKACKALVRSIERDSIVKDLKGFHVKRRSGKKK